MAIKMVFYQSTPYGEIRKFVCSLDSDRSNLPISTSSTNRCDATSEAFIEETGKTYYLSSGDLWLEKKNLILPAGTNTTRCCSTRSMRNMRSGICGRYTGGNA